MIPLLTLALRDENDVVVARQRARQLAPHLGFDAQDQARIATAVSELARNVVQYAGRGRIAFALEGRTPPQLPTIHVGDQGPGIADLDLILSGRYHDARERRQLEDLGAILLAKSSLSSPKAAELLADALRRAGGTGECVARPAEG